MEHLADDAAMEAQATLLYEVVNSGLQQRDYHAGDPYGFPFRVLGQSGIVLWVD